VITTEAPSFFQITAQYRRFAEICNKSQTGKFISLFYGKTGLGKTECAYHYANWRVVEPLLEKSAAARKLPNSVIHSSTVVYTPDVGITPKRVQSGIATLRNRFDELVDQAANWYSLDTGAFRPHKYLKLLIIDEADRLKLGALEVIRDLYDRTPLNILLIGSPGIERRLRRSGYGQLHSRFTLAYEIQPLTNDEMRVFIARKWQELNLPCTADDAVSTAIMRIAHGNLRVLHRIFAEIKRLQKINCLLTITPDLVEVARKGLLLGTT
jgi:DNA transposition AAA+ family ATPase